MLKEPPQILPSYLNKHISYFCAATLAKDDLQNHCAHFVSHVMQYEVEGSATCKTFTLKDKKTIEHGASIRVNEVFNKLQKTGEWESRPEHLRACLMFVTISSNMRNRGNHLVMGDRKKKHIGILYKDKIWNYSNSNDKVVADSVAIFINKFKHYYITAGNTVNFYYGGFS